MKLGLFSVATLYVRNTSGNQRALADTLVGITFIRFFSYNSVSWLEAADRQQMVEAHTETQVAEVH